MYNKVWHFINKGNVQRRTKAKVIEYLYVTNCVTCMCYNYDIHFA